MSLNNRKIISLIFSVMLLYACKQSPKLEEKHKPERKEISNPSFAKGNFSNFVKEFPKASLQEVLSTASYPIKGVIEEKYLEKYIFNSGKLPNYYGGKNYKGYTYEYVAKFEENQNYIGLLLNCSSEMSADTYLTATTFTVEGEMIDALIVSGDINYLNNTGVKRKSTFEKEILTVEDQEGSSTKYKFTGSGKIDLVKPITNTEISPKILEEILTKQQFIKIVEPHLFKKYKLDENNYIVYYESQINDYPLFLVNKENLITNFSISDKDFGLSLKKAELKDIDGDKVDEIIFYLFERKNDVLSHDRQEMVVFKVEEEKNKEIFRETTYEYISNDMSDGAAKVPIEITKIDFKENKIFFTGTSYSSQEGKKGNEKQVKLTYKWSSELRRFLKE